MHLPDAPPPHEERERRRLVALHEAEQEAAGAHVPLHCSPTAGPRPGGCADDADSVTTKQQNQMKVFAGLAGVAPPSAAEVVGMTKEDAAQWVHARWAAHVSHGKGWRDQASADARQQRPHNLE